MPSKHVVLDEQLAGYISARHSGAADPLLLELEAETAALPEAGMQISPEQGTLLTLLAAATGARRAIEIGTFTGYSALCLARGMGAGGRLWCCDVSAEWTAVARRYWARAGIADQIELRLGPAAETLRQLPETPPFDLAFIDADKDNYDLYYELLLPRVRPGGLLIFDNMLWDGRVAASPPEGTAALLHQLNEKLATDPRVLAVLLPVADGVTVCRKN